MRRLIPLLLLAVSPLPLASAAAQTEAAAPALLDVPKLQFTKRILANGATLYAIRDTATATVSINIWRSEEHTSELQSLMRISYAVFCLKKKKHKHLQHKELYQKNTHDTT